MRLKLIQRSFYCNENKLKSNFSLILYPTHPTQYPTSYPPVSSSFVTCFRKLSKCNLPLTRNRRIFAARRLTNRKPIVVIVSGMQFRVQNNPRMKHVATGQFVACGTIVWTSKNYPGTPPLPPAHSGNSGEILDFDLEPVEGGEVCK